MTPSLTDSRSTHTRLHAPQYGFALTQRNPLTGGSQSRHAPSVRSTTQRAALLEAPSHGKRTQHQSLGIGELLNVLGLGACEINGDAKGLLPCQEMALKAGEVLYEQGQHRRQAFAILSGVLAREQLPADRIDSLLGPAPIALSGARELIGLHLGSGFRTEKAVAITEATVLEFPIKALQAIAPASTAINDLLMRTAGATLFRDWRVSYRLRDLPDFARTVAGLSHLAHLAEFKPGMSALDGSIALLMPATKLALWLAMDVDVLRTQLKRLERYGVVSTSADAVVWLDPLQLETLWSVD